MIERRDPLTPETRDDATPTRPGSFARLPRSVVSRTRILLASGALLGLIGAGWMAFGGWNSAREWFLARPEFAVPFERVELDPPPPPAYRGGAEALIARVREQSRRDRPVRLLDEDLEALGRTFAMHSPWVEGVERAERRDAPSGRRAHPDRIVLRLRYREPVARIPMGASRSVALSADGVILPGEDLAPAEAQRLLVLDGLGDGLSLRPGHYLAADQTGAIPPKVASILGLIRDIRGADDPEAPRIASVNLSTWPVAWLTTRGGVIVRWGRADGEKAEGEPSPSEKLERLARWEVANDAKVDLGSVYLRFTGDGIELKSRPKPPPG